MCSPLRYLSLGRQSPAQRFRADEKWTKHNTGSDLTGYQVKEYLARYPVVLEEFLLNEIVSLQFLENILDKKRSSPCKNDPRAPNARICSIVSAYSATGVEKLSTQINSCTKDEDIWEQIYNMSQVVGCTINADKVNMYVVSSSNWELSVYNQDQTMKVVGPMGPKMTVSAHVAAEQKSINVSDLPQDSRFPKGVALGDEDAHHVIAIPIVLDNGRCYAVLEFIRGWNKDKFSSLDFEVAIAIASWVNACVQKMKYNKDALNKFLLETTKVMFDDMENIDLLVTNIMMFTKDLVSADRCSLFLVDNDRNELFSDYFDDGQRTDDGKPVFTKKSQIRFPLAKGIAGYVAKTQQIVNIHDAYSDDRFNPEIDKKTGYKTKNILCMPISGRHGVIGVVQMINRLDGDYFTEDDESAFKLFAVYCALALHYSRVYNILAHQKAQYKVAMEVLEFHIATGETETKKLMDEFHLPDDRIPATFDNYDFFAYDAVDILPHLFVKIVVDTFGDTMFDMEKICRFTLTVRKNYRPVSYHNWEHGFHVAHAIWQMLKTAKSTPFSNLAKMALVFGAVCHDLDHRGYNNDFLKKTENPLSALYTTSIMEYHHYKQTVTILHAEGHDIFSFLTSDEHTELLEQIRLNILATDLATYFDNQKYLKGLIEADEFDLNIKDHRKALHSLMMTGADLVAVPKPWETQKRNVESLYNEFWIQGDEEKKRGMKPLAMMDRDCKDEVPKQQVGFINFICIPMYTTLSTLLPETRPLLDGVLRNKDHWEALTAEQVTKQTTLKT
ncbi:hypothetical protein ACF0H5_010387 [Mactra antiquata]